MSAAEGFTLRSPASLVLAVQAEKFPDSKPSAKIRSDRLDVFVGVGVLVGVKVAVAVGVLVCVFVGVGEGPDVGVFVGVEVGVLVGVFVGVDVGPDVGVFVGLAVGFGAVANSSKPSTSLAERPHVLPSK